MSLAAELVRTYFGDTDPPAAVWIGLGRANGEISVSGYERRVVVRGAWRIDGRTATVTSTFGPFSDGPIEFDRALVFVAGELLQEVPFEGGAVRLTKGMSFEHETVIETTELGGA